MSKAQICPTHLLSDEPSADDTFGKAHQRVARAIAEIIRSAQEKGGKAIGLEGGWGTGKTTIVRLLVSDFANDKNYLFFLFDAWAHEGDPLRRTFLESLIDEFTRKEWLDDKQKNFWKEEKEIIAQRKEVKKTKNKPYFTKLGMAVVASLFCVPLGTAFLNAALRDNLLIDFSLPWSTISWKFLIGLFLIFTPLLLVGLAAFRQGSSSTIWAMLVNKAIAKEQTKTNKTANPTSVEFESYFSRLMSEALGGEDGKSRKLILVLDNLDRIGAAEALKIWSTLQTFLNLRSSPAGDQPPDWLDRLWVLMPYDLEGISRLWKKPKEKDTEKPASDESTAASQQAQTPAAEKPKALTREAEENAVALSFLDKSFHVRFEVPPPVLSNWQSFLLGMCQRAFPGHSLAEFHSIYRLYYWYLEKTSQLPNPRQLKLYINQIGALHRQRQEWHKENPQWGREFPFSHLAYYVLLRRLNCHVVRELLDGKLPEADVAELLDEGAADNLAALAFNTDVETAKQIVLGDPLRQAFENRDAAKLRELHGNHRDKGFWEALDNLKWSEFFSQTLANAAYCLGNLLDSLQGEKEFDERQADIHSIKRSLRRNAARQTQWRLADPSAVESIAVLCNMITDEKIVGGILKSLSANFIQSPLQRGQPSGAFAWAAMAQALQNTLSHDLLAAYSQGVIEPLVKSVQTQDKLAMEKLNQLLETLFELSLSSDSANEALKDLATQGKINTEMYREIFLSASPTQEAISAVAWWVIILLRHNINAISLIVSRLSPSSPTEQEQEEDARRPEDAKRLRNNRLALAGELSQLLRRYNRIEDLFELDRENAASEPLVVDCLRILVEDESNAVPFTAEQILVNWHLFKQLREGEFGKTPLDKLITRLLKETAFLDEVMRQPFQSQLAELYSVMALKDAISHTDFADWLVRHLHSVSKDEWLADLRSEAGDLYRLLLATPSLSQRLSLLAYQDALVERAAEIIKPHKDYSMTHRTTGRSLILCASHSEEQRDTLRKRLYEVALAADGDISDTFFRLFDEEILYPDIVDDRLYLRLLTPVLQKGREYALDWLIKVVEWRTDAFDDSRLEGYGEFKEAVRQRLPAYLRGDTYRIRRKPGATADEPIAIRYGDRVTMWTPNPLKSDDEFVDRETADAAIAGGGFTLVQPVSDPPSSSIIKLARILGLIPDTLTEPE